MSPVLRPLAPSEAKSRFISHLQLDQPARQHLYAMMKVGSTPSQLFLC